MQIFQLYRSHRLSIVRQAYCEIERGVNVTNEYLQLNGVEVPSTVILLTLQDCLLGVNKGDQTFLGIRYDDILRLKLQF